MAQHELKTLSAPFEAVWNGRKTHEIRVNDRSFAVGDRLYLREYDLGLQRFLSRSILVEVTYITPGGHWGLSPDLCVMSIKLLGKEDMSL